MRGFLAILKKYSKIFKIWQKVQDDLLDFSILRIWSLMTQNTPPLKLFCNIQITMRRLDGGGIHVGG